MTERTSGVVLASMAWLCCLFIGELVAGEQQLRSMKYTAGAREDAIVWQKDVRAKLVELLKMDDLVSAKRHIPFHATTFSSEKKEKYVFQEMEIHSTPGRRIKLPAEGGAR